MIDLFVFFTLTPTLTYKGNFMFGLFKSDPTKKLRKQYDKLSTDAMLAQRKGDIKTYSLLTAEAEQLWSQIEALQFEQQS